MVGGGGRGEEERDSIVTLPPEMSPIATRSLFGGKQPLSHEGVPCIDLGFSTESVSPVLSTSETNTRVAHTTSLSVSFPCV